MLSNLARPREPHMVIIGVVADMLKRAPQAGKAKWLPDNRRMQRNCTDKRLVG